jgi:c-di-GMP-binding flagellar brake protein YcgR
VPPTHERPHLHHHASSNPWDIPTDGGAGRSAWISSPTKLGDLTAEACRAPSLQLLFEASHRALRVQMQLVGGAPGQTTKLALRGREVRFDEETWGVGDHVTLWFAKVDGLFAFRSTVLSELRDGLLLSAPDAVFRHCRRARQRYQVPAASLPRIAMSLEDGAWQDLSTLHEFSTHGLRVSGPKDLEAELGHLVRVGLTLGGKKRLEINAFVRSVQPEGEDGKRLGLEFTGLASTTRLVLERWLVRVQAVPLPDAPGSHLPALPDAVRALLMQSPRTSATSGTSHRRPTTGSIRIVG